MCLLLYLIAEFFMFMDIFFVSRRPEGKKYEKALEWGIQVVNAGFLAEIIHNGQVPAVLFPRHTKLGGLDEFSSSACFEATKLLSKQRVGEGFPKRSYFLKVLLTSADLKRL